MNITFNSQISFQAKKYNGGPIPIANRSKPFYDCYYNKSNKQDIFVKSSKTKSTEKAEPEVYEYENLFDTKLKAEFKSDLKADLDFDITVYNPGRAEKRIKSLSKYLKEQMVGYITPDGEHWFENALTYLIKGSAGVDMNPEVFDKHGVYYAKEFWGLLAKADDYWKSDEFLSYLQNNMNQDDPGVKATIKAVKQLKITNKARNSQVAFGYDSKMKSVPELLRVGAYSGRPLVPGSRTLGPSLEHILPHSTSGDELNVDSNYLLAGRQINSARGSIPLLDFLKGWNADEYSKFRHKWKSTLKYRLKKDLTIEQRFAKLSDDQKEKVEKYEKKVLSGKCTKKELFELNSEIYDIVVARTKSAPVKGVGSFANLKFLLG